MRTINSLVEELYNSNVLRKNFIRIGVPSDDIDDLCQDLYLYWLTNPDSILEAEQGGYLDKFITTSCKNQAILNFKRRSRFVSDEEYLNSLISE